MSTTRTKTRKGGRSRSADRKEKARGPLGSESRVSVVAAVILFAIAFICYINSLENGFVFDDHLLVLVHGRPDGLSELPSRLLSSYRPVRTLSYAIDFMVWGDAPFGFHLTNVLIHGANSTLVFLLARALGLRPFFAFLAGLVFAVHPIQTDAVAYVSGRRDVLFTLFFLASFLSYLAFSRSGQRKYSVLFVVFWGLSLLSKEMAISLPAVIFLFNFCRILGEGEGNLAAATKRAITGAFRKDPWLYLLSLAAGLAFAWYSVIYVRASGRVGNGALEYWGGSFFSSIMTVARVHAWYLKQLIYPTPIAQYFGVFEPSTSLGDARVILSLVLVAGVVAGAFLFLRRDWRIGFAILSYFAILLPVSQIIPHHELAADHYLYLPIACFGLLVALVVARVSAVGQGVRLAAGAVVLLACALFSLGTVERNRDWRSDASLWRANYEAVPDSPRAAYNYASVLIRDDPAQAEELLKRARDQDPTFEPTYLSLGRLYLSQKRLDEARKAVEEGLELVDAAERSFILRNPRLLRAQFLVLLAGVEWEEGRPELLESNLLGAIGQYPRFVDPFEGLANYYRETDRSREAEILQRGFEANPRSLRLGSRLLSVLLEQGRNDEAIELASALRVLRPLRSECMVSERHLSEVRKAIAGDLGLASIRQAIEDLDEVCRTR